MSQLPKSRTSIRLHLASCIFYLGLPLLAACATMPIPTRTSATTTPTLTPLPTLTLAPTSTNPPIPTSTAIPTNTPTSTSTPLPTTTLAPINYSQNPRAILIEADTTDSTTSRDEHVPIFRLYADGLVILAGNRPTNPTGLDATARTGKLSDSEIQNLLAYLTQVGFFNLKNYYEPRPKPTDAPTAYLSVYLNQAKTVRVYDPTNETTPQSFTDAFTRIAQTIPADAQTFIPTDGYLESTDAGAANNLTTKNTLVDWANVNARLADVIDGTTISGRTFDQVVALTANKPGNTLYREGDHVYRVRFAPNLPRAAHLTDSIGTILNAPREFDGRVFDIVGYFRGWNLLGEASGSAPVTRNDWVIADASGAIYVTGAPPRGLDPSSRDNIWNVIHLNAKVVYVRLGASYLEVRRVDNLSQNATPIPTPSSTPTSTFIANSDAAIALVQARFSEVSKIQKTSSRAIGASSDIQVFERPDGWDMAFWQGAGDCPSGCINNHYYYFSVKKDGTVTKVGEYARNYDASANSFETSGVSMWGYPK